MKKRKPKILVFAGYGLNCEEETKYAFDSAGGDAIVVHINDLVSGEKKIKDFEILAFPGGFSYGDDTGSGKAYANKIKNHLKKDLDAFVEKGGLVIGICNGFQILTQIGLLPGALTHNSGARYLDRWVDVDVNSSSPWLAGIKTMSLPIAHGEGRYLADKETLKNIKSQNLIAVTYMKGEICEYQNLPSNPNGAMEDIAGVLAYEGRVLGMMPHPERGMFVSQMPNFSYLKEKSLRNGKKLPLYNSGFQIFKNAVEYCKKKI